LSPESAGTISGSGKSVTVNWDPGFSGNCNISFLASGANSFKAVSPALQVNVLPKPTKPIIPDGPVSLFQNAPLADYSTAKVDDALSYEWKIFPPEAGKIYPNETNCKIEWNEPFLGYAYLSVRAENGCGMGKYSDSLKINVQEAELAYGIINIFTPNGDGFNDYWSIPFIKDFPDAVIKIFDRNNQLLVEYKGADSSWNGTVNGELVPMGNYLYMIDLKNGKPPIKGYVTVLR
jgi:gliding motility-associated-like protein